MHLLYSTGVPDSNPGQGTICIEFACFSCACVGFLPPTKTCWLVRLYVTLGSQLCVSVGCVCMGTAAHSFQWAAVLAFPTEKGDYTISLRFLHPHTPCDFTCGVPFTMNGIPACFLAAASFNCRCDSRNHTHRCGPSLNWPCMYSYTRDLRL